MSKRELFLAELKLQYDKEFELKNTIENKANYILAAAGIVITLLFSFASPLITDKLAQHNPVFSATSILLITSLSANVLAILCSILAFKITPYSFSMPSDAFYDDDNCFDDKAVAEYRDGDDIDEFRDNMIDNYIRCNRHNGSMNTEKTIKVKIAQWSFFAGVTIIPIIISIIMLK